MAGLGALSDDALEREREEQEQLLVDALVDSLWQDEPRLGDAHAAEADALEPAEEQLQAEDEPLAEEYVDEQRALELIQAYSESGLHQLPSEPEPEAQAEEPEEPEEPELPPIRFKLEQFVVSDDVDEDEDEHEHEHANQQADPAVEAEPEAQAAAAREELDVEQLALAYALAEAQAQASAEAEAEAEAELQIEVEGMDEDATAFLEQVTGGAFDERASDPLLDAPANVDPLRVPAWNKLNTSAYAFVRGLRGMAQSPLVQLLAVGTMAVCMLLLGTTMLIFQNATRVAHDLGIDTPVTVYMQPGTEASEAVQLRERIAALPEVERADRVSPEQALERLQEGLGTGSTSTVQRGALLEGIEPSSLPESIEVALVAGVEPGFADALAGRLQSMEGVEEVSVLGPWVQEVESMLSTLRWLALGVGALVSLACLAIVWSTIRLGVFARRSEIHILRLVGGTQRFVRGPFVVEGVLQGVMGTALALAGLWLAFEITRPFLERGMSLLFAAGSLHFFTMIELGVALVFGAMLGLIGSRAAVARHAQG